MKTELTIEESAKLVELGVDPKLASRWVKYGERVFDGNPQPNPVFTLTDLLSILPKEINGRSLTITSTERFSFAFYAIWEKEYIHSAIEQVKHFYGDTVFKFSELIDALYQLLIWAIEHNHLKTEKK